MSILESGILSEKIDKVLTKFDDVSLSGADSEPYYSKDQRFAIDLFVKYALSGSEDDESWSVHQNTDSLKIKYKYDPNKGIGVVYASTIIDCAPEQFYEGFSDWKLVKTFDPMCVDVKLQKKYDENRRVAYAAFKSGFAPFVWNRDIAYEELRVLADSKGEVIDSNTEETLSEWKEMEHRCCIAVVHSINADHPFCYPNQEKEQSYVRAQLHVAGYMFQDLGDGRSRATYVVQLDPKGWVPQWVANLVGPKQGENVLRLKTYIDGLKSAAVEEKSTDNEK